MDDLVRATTLTRPKEISEGYMDMPEHVLLFRKSKIRNFKVNVGSHFFVFWFFVWTYLPLFTACTAPLTNMLSVAALVTRWRDSSDGTSLQDEVPVLVLNAISLALGEAANVCLLLNFGKRVSYQVSQPLSTGLFSLASVILMGALIVSQKHYFDLGFVKTEGFWFGVLTCVFYGICSLTCFMNMLGTLLKKYPPDFNLERSERGLVIYTFLLAAWFMWGAAMFKYLIGISYGNAMYFCVVSVLTVGFGDIVPGTNLAKALLLLYALSGLVILGLIIVMIRTTVTHSAAPVLFWSTLEKKRSQLLKKLEKQNVELSQEDSFDLMRSLRRSSKEYKEHVNSFWSLLVFVVFWLLGALVFFFTEDWSYFNAVYFSLLSLMTIGYGDYTPKSAAGRVFFIMWALLAVPMMTALISSVGDSVYGLALQGASSRLVKQIFRHLPPSDKSEPMFEEYDTDEDMDDEDTRSTDTIIRDAEHRKHRVVKVSSILQTLETLISESREKPLKRYTFDEWQNVISQLEFTDEEAAILGTEDNKFWLSDQSPLRFPIYEPNYLVFLLFSKLQSLVETRIEELEQEVSIIQPRDRSRSSQDAETNTIDDTFVGTSGTSGASTTFQK